MTDPRLALAVAGVVGALLYFLFRPGAGYFWKWYRIRHMSERVLIEDALKHLYDCEYQQRQATVQSVSGALAVSGDEAADLLRRIEGRELIESRQGRVQLTPSGRDYALRVIRAHRLWERYLSDETGLSEADWHREAEHQEHALTVAQADALAAQMGNPPYDPHGDPIPTQFGDLPPRRGQPLTALAVGQLADIVHVEDEPEAVYAQLVAEGLHPGMRVQVAEVTPERIRFWGDGEEHVLAPIMAANVSVVQPVGDHQMEGPFQTLSVMKPGEKATVTGISRSCRGLERRRLMDLGIVPGTLIEAEMTSPAGDPIAYRVRETLIALRQDQASLVHISPLHKEAVQ
ncbi:MAG: FeoA domain-containing protein [Acidobacteriota bacterium]